MRPFLLDESTVILKCFYFPFFLIWNWFCFYMNLWFYLHKIFTCCVCVVKIIFTFTLPYRRGFSRLPSKSRGADLPLSKPKKAMQGRVCLWNGRWSTISSLISSFRPRSDWSAYAVDQSLSTACQIWGNVLCRFSNCRKYHIMEHVNDLPVGPCWSGWGLSPSCPFSHSLCPY